MLRETKGAWSVVCDRCFAVAELAATTLLDARDAARSTGWLDQPRKGKVVDRCPWLCPRCRPGDASGQMGRST